MLLKTRSRSKREQKHFPDYLDKIRQCPCVICGGEAEAAHLRMSSARHGKVNGRDDKWVTPLCPGHHRLYPYAQHNSGEDIWWQRQGLDPLELAKRLWDARHDLEQMRGIVMNIKATKEEVSYGIGKPSERCGLCRYYSSHSCSLVQGRIDPSHWCTLFKRRET